MKNVTKNIADILQKSSLSRVVERVNELRTLHQKIQQQLPKQYEGLCRVVNIVENQLVIEVQNASVRQGLWLQQTTLLKQIQIALPHITALKLNINPNFKAY